MTHTYQIDGMHCASCISKVKNELLKIGSVKNVQVQLQLPQATVTMEQNIAITELQQAVANAGPFSLKEINANTEHHITNNEKTRSLATYKPLLIVVAFITGITTVTSWQDSEFNWMQWMNNFMGAFFIAFSFFKLLDIKGFADSFRSYDLLAKRVYTYALVYPFIELGLGIAYIIRWQPLFINLVTAVVMVLSGIGVIQTVVNKKQIRCACLGTVFNLPMSTVTIIEVLIMAGMALFSLLMLE